MMDHIINFDWNYREPEEYFIRPEDLDNSVTERILRNKFRDPLISSDEEGDDNKPQKVNWNELIENKNKKQQNRVFVPGLLKPPAYLKLSALTYHQHRNCLKVLCAQEPHILPAAFMQRPNKMDLQTMEAVRDIYEKEQKEFMDWAKLLWATDHCRRVLRPKPRVEAIYEAHFKIRAQEMQTFPKSLRLAAQIPLETTNGNVFDFVHQKDLISVNIDELPEVECPMNLEAKLCIMKPSPIPEPCPQHTCRFVLPTESAVTEKPLVEVYRALAQFAIENGATCVAEENALACLLEQDRTWMLPLSIVDTFGSDGEPCNVIVLGQEFDALKETPPVRNYRAFKHMLDVALVPETELFKLRYANIKALTSVSQDKDANSTSFGMPGDDLDSSDDDDAMMIIDTGNDEDDDIPLSSPKKSRSVITRSSPRFSPRIQKMSECKDTDSAQAKSPEKQNKRSSGSTCTCKGSLFENPPPRSYRKWRLSNKTANDNIDVIIHCAHKLKVKDKSNELILEPIPEYQLDLGASQLPEGRTTSLDLALILRKNATLANVRVNGSNGDIVRVDCRSDRQLSPAPRIANVLHSAVDQLRGLLPGHYVLKHDPSHGPNALLFATKGRNCSEQLSLQFDHTTLSVPDESLTVKTPPKLIPLLLPMHKHRTMLPLAFTHVQKEVLQESKKPVTRAKPPPQALQLANGVETPAKKQWPKKKGRKRKQRD